MTNRFFNLPENIISQIYYYDITFHNKFKKDVLPEMISLMWWRKSLVLSKLTYKNKRFHLYYYDRR